MPMGNVYPAEFKAQVVELHRRQGRSLAELGREFHLSATTVANWVREANAADAKDPTLTSEERAELVMVRRQLKAREEAGDPGKGAGLFARRQAR
jgi:transposase